MAETKNGIKYPDNYNSVADIPKDLKDMAESIDAQIANKVEKVDGKGLSTNDFTNAYKEKLDGLNNYNDTKIKQDIKDIKDEQETQNDDIDKLKAQKEALEKEVERQKEDNRLNSLTEDNEGELVHINNSTGSRFNALEISGNEKQDTREGYNIINMQNAIGGTSNGITCTINNDGTYSCVGTAESSAINIWLLGNYGSSNILFTLKAGTYYVRDVRLYSKEKTIGYSNDDKEDTGHIFTILEDIDITGVRVATAIAGQTYNMTKYPLLALSDVELPFEKYGVMPSFDYPSKVECVGDNKNIFDDSYYKGFVVTTENYNNQEFSPISLEVDKYYGARIWFTDGTYAVGSDFMIYLFDDTNSTKSIANLVNNTPKKFANASEIARLKIIANATGLSTYANKVVAGIKIEEVADVDGQATNYSEYNQGNINFKICNKNINDNEFEIGTILDDTGYEGTSKNYIRSKNYLRLDSGDYTIFAYKFSGISILNTAIRLYDRNKKYLRNLYIGRIDANTFNFNITEDVYFGRLVCLNNEAVPSDFSVEIQIEKGMTKTNYKEHEEQNYVIPVQQRMFSGDKFIKVDGIWKEIHIWKELNLSQVNFWKTDNSANSDSILRFTTSVNDGSVVMNGRAKPKTVLCEKLDCIYIIDAYTKECIATHTASNHLNIFINKNRLTDETVEAFKQYLTQNEIIVYYKLAEPLYLDCTKEQTEILNKIEQEAKTYEGVTNIYTEDEVGAIIKTNTNVDLKTVINNVVEAQLKQIGG